MAFWDRLASRGRVDDRRSMGPTAIGGGLGIGGIALYLLFTYLSGGQISIDDPVVNDILNQIQQSQVTQSSLSPTDFEGADQYEVFASTVLGSTNDMWRSVFAQQNLEYIEPTLVLFRGSTESECGGASSQIGPHYCPYDGVIYLDETFFDELQRLGAVGDVAQAYVIAHEVGHHVQNLLGTMDTVDQMDNESSVRIELQADCYAGLWAHSIRELGVFEPGEIQEALDAAAAVGDDHIQSTMTGRIRPENWTHGSSADRTGWFERGFNSGTVGSCDTISP